MKAVATQIKQEPRSFRERDHRITKLPVKTILTDKMDLHGIKNVDLQKALGYPAPNVIAMMKSGVMRLPAKFAMKTAELLKINKQVFFAKVVQESDPVLPNRRAGPAPVRSVHLRPPHQLAAHAGPPKCR